jgi:rubrerythrin
MKDTIYRQDAIDGMKKLQRWNVVRGYNKNEGFLYDDVMYLLDNLSPARIERKKGRWINAYPDIESNPMFMYGICSVCGYEQSISNKLNFCPNCGADMRGDEE